MEDAFKVTDEELEKFKSAMKKKEFRDLLVDYVKEIQDPENKKKYEEEIVELEKRRGQNVKFLNPKPGFVMKLYLQPGRRKIFVNIATSDAIAEATCFPAAVKAGSKKKKKGTDWHVPFTLTSPRDDLDKSGKRCKVYDCVFHPKTYKRGQKYQRFKQLLVETAVEAIEEAEGGKAAPEHVKFLSLSYKGLVQPAVVREREKGDRRKEHGKGRREKEDDLPFGVPYPPLPSKNSSTKKGKKAELKKGPSSPSPSSSSSSSSSSPSSSSPSEPVYSVKYRGEVAMEDFTNDRVSPVVKRPKEIIVTVKLPGLTSAGTVELDVTEKQLLLDNNQPPYHLDLALSYPVDSDRGTAEFDKSSRCLTVTLPVLPSLPSPPPHTITQSTNENAVSRSHDLVNDESSNQVAELESHDGENREPTNQIAALKDSTPPTADTQSEAVTTSPNDLTNHIAEPGMTSSDDSTNQNAELSNVTWASKGEWVAPSFTYRQDNERVVFVLHSSGIKPSTVVHHHDNQQFQVMYSCSDDNKQIINHALLVRFHGDDLVENTSVDVTEENMVVVVAKTLECQREWVWFEAGVNSHSTQRKLFLTEENVACAEEEMKQDCDPWKGCGSNESEVKVSFSDTQLEVEMEKIGHRPEPDEVERNQDTMDQNRDSSGGGEEESVSCTDKLSDGGKKESTTSGTGERQNGDCDSQTGMECGHETRDIQLTNDLLFNLD